MQHRKGQMSQFCATAFLVWLCAAVIIISGCNPAPVHTWDSVNKNIREKFPSVKHISTEELQEWLNDEKSVAPLILDRREPEEHTVSHLPEAILAVNREAAIKIITRDGQDRSIVLYCSVGYRAAELAEQLQKKNFTEVYNLEGSMFKWANEGRAIYQGAQPVNKVHFYNSKWKHLLDKRLRHDP